MGIETAPMMVKKRIGNTLRQQLNHAAWYIHKNLLGLISEIIRENTSLLTNAAINDTNVVLTSDRIDRHTYI